MYIKKIYVNDVENISNTKDSISEILKRAELRNMRHLNRVFHTSYIESLNPSPSWNVSEKEISFIFQRFIIEINWQGVYTLSLGR